MALRYAMVLPLLCRTGIKYMRWRIPPRRRQAQMKEVKRLPKAKEQLQSVPRLASSSSQSSMKSLINGKIGKGARRRSLTGTSLHLLRDGFGRPSPLLRHPALTRRRQSGDRSRWKWVRKSQERQSEQELYQPKSSVHFSHNAASSLSERTDA